MERFGEFLDYGNNTSMTHATTPLLLYVVVVQMSK